LREQLQKFRLKYPAGFSSEGWQNDEQNLVARRVREGAARRAQQELSAKSLDALTKDKRLESVWALVVARVGESGLVSEELATTASTDQQRVLAEAVRDLLHGSDHYERRFDRFVMRYESVFKSAPSWQAATVLPALVSPVAHVCVEPAVFRKQLKALSRQSTLAVRPNGATYARCLGTARTARALASALAAEGEVPADLLEIVAYMRTTA
jgi:hypothetical protein